MVFIEKDRKKEKLGACLGCPKNQQVVTVSPKTAVIIQKSADINFVSLRVKCGACGNQLVNPIVSVDSYAACPRFVRKARRKGKADADIVSISQSSI